MKTTIYVIRHGQSIGNAKRIYLGRTDWDLTEEGYKQAEETAEILKDMKIDVVYSSSLVRAHNTALPHARLRGLSVNDDDNLREIYLGKWECRPVPELKQDEYFVKGWCENFGTCTPPEGESVRAAGERMYNAVFEIAKKNEGKNILITAHAAVIRSLWGMVSEIAWEDLASAVGFPTNASITTIFFDGEKLIPGSYSDDKHLIK